MANKYYIINVGHRQVKDVAKEYALAELKRLKAKYETK